jgi:hypothetical protein
MFVQVIRGKVKNADALLRQEDRWQAELGPGAKGWLGATAGVAADGTAITVVRFESEDAAKANGDRPEQTQWWEETQQLYEGPVTFYNCPDVMVLGKGGSDDAGFVQIMMYKTTDPAAVKELTNQFDDMGSIRPDVIGSTMAFATDGTVIDTIYFTSEKEARAAESKEMPAEMQQAMERMQQVTSDLEYIDLSNPTLSSP